jgi:sulfide:quinone oxidoreductase
VVIAGGGVGALEAALATSRLAGARVRLTLLARGPEFFYQPMAVLEPFAKRSPRRLPLERFAAELGIDFVMDSFATLDTGRGTLRTAGGRELRYDALVLAVGARTAASPSGVLTVDIPGTHDSLHSLIEEIEGGSVASVALVAPHPTWPLPVYELALLLREHARERGTELELTVITAESAPLSVFGDAVSGALSDLLRGAEIATMLETEVSQAGDELLAEPGGGPLRFDRVVALPRLRGPAFDGLPADAEGFLRVSRRGEVLGVPGVYAVGDATDFPVKYGALAAAQADAAAALIASTAGAQVEPIAFDGTVHGFLLVGRNAPRLYFSARIEGGVASESRISETPTDALAAKVAAHHLGPYLDELWASGARWLSGPWTADEAPAVTR